MKIVKKSWIAVLALSGIIAVGCAATSGGGTISEKALSYRNTDLYSEDNTVPPPVEYTKAAPGTAKRFERSFVNAPPLIPHSVEGLLPITKKNNACLGCHMPNVAKSMGATPIPPSHFTDFRPATKIGADGKVIKEGKVVANSSDIGVVLHKEHKLYEGRYNCSQCHVPQANAKPLVANNFKPEFKSKEEMHRSDLLKVLNEGVDIK